LTAAFTAGAISREGYVAELQRLRVLGPAFDAEDDAERIEDALPDDGGVPLPDFA